MGEIKSNNEDIENMDFSSIEEESFEKLLEEKLSKIKNPSNENILKAETEVFVKKTKDSCEILKKLKNKGRSEIPAIEEKLKKIKIYSTHDVIEEGFKDIEKDIKKVELIIETEGKIDKDEEDAVERGDSRVSLVENSPLSTPKEKKRASEAASRAKKEIEKTGREAKDELKGESIKETDYIKLIKKEQQDSDLKFVPAKIKALKNLRGHYKEILKKLKDQGALEDSDIRSIENKLEDLNIDMTTEDLQNRFKEAERDIRETRSKKMVLDGQKDGPMADLHKGLVKKKKEPVDKETITQPGKEGEDNEGLLDLGSLESKKGEVVSLESISPEDIPKNISLKDSINFVKLKTRTSLTDIEIEEQVKVANPDKIRKDVKMLDEVSELTDLLKESDDLIKSEKNEIFEQISRSTGLPSFDIGEIFDHQLQIIEKKARNKVAGSESMKKKLAKTGGKITAYMGAGLGVGMATGGVGLFAGLGVASVGALRVLESYRTGQVSSKKLESSINEVKLELENLPNRENFINNIIAEIATYKQNQIDNKKENISSAEEDLEGARDNYLDSDSNHKTKLDLSYSKLDGLNQGQLEIYLKNLKVGKEERENILKSTSILNKINFENLLVAEKFQNRKKGFFDRAGSNIGKAWDATLGSKYLKGGDSAREKATTSAVFVGMGAVARGLPVVRNILMGYGGMKLGDFAGNFIKEKQICAKDLINPNNQKDSREFGNLVMAAKTQLLDDKFKTENPTEHSLLKIEIDKIDEENVKKIKNVKSFISNYSDQLEQNLKDKYTQDKLNRITKIDLQVLGGLAAGFFGDDLVRELGEVIKHWNSDDVQVEKIQSGSPIHKSNRVEVVKPTINHSDTVMTEGDNSLIGEAENKDPEKFTPDPFAPIPNSTIAETVGVNESATVETSGEVADVEKNVLAKGVGVEVTATEVVAEDAIIRKGEGVEHALIRQLKANPGEFGFEGDANNVEEVEKWAGREAHKIAIHSGYTNAETGSEVRVGTSGIDKSAYVLKHNASGKLEIEEHFKNEKGEFVSQESHGEASVFEESKNREEYEYGYKKEQPEKIANIETGIFKNGELEKLGINIENEADKALADYLNENPNLLKDDIVTTALSAQAIQDKANFENISTAAINEPPVFKAEDVNLENPVLAEKIKYLCRDTGAEPSKVAKDILDLSKDTGASPEKVLDNFKQLFVFSEEKRQAVFNLLNSSNVRESLASIFNKPISSEQFSYDDGLYKIKDFKDGYDLFLTKDSGQLKFSLDGPGGINLGDDSTFGVSPNLDLNPDNIEKANSWLNENLDNEKEDYGSEDYGKLETDDVESKKEGDIEINEEIPPEILEGESRVMLGGRSFESLEKFEDYLKDQDYYKELSERDKVVLKTDFDNLNNGRDVQLAKNSINGIIEKSQYQKGFSDIFEGSGDSEKKVENLLEFIKNKNIPNGLFADYAYEELVKIAGSNSLEGVDSGRIGDALLAIQEFSTEQDLESQAPVESAKKYLNLLVKYLEKKNI